MQTRTSVPASYKPKDSDFAKVWAADSANQRRESQRDYLDWVHQYYNGAMFTQGWSDREKRLLSRLSDSGKTTVIPQLNAVGFLVCGEWSKDNSVRRIDTNDLSQLGNILDNAARADDGSGKSISQALTKLRTRIDQILSKGAKVPLPANL